MGKKLTKAEIEKYRLLLVHIRGVISGDIDGLETDAFVNDGERPPSDSPADVGTDRFSQQFSLELLARDEQTLFEVDEALDRVAGESFGCCESCENWIRKSRLNAVPFARQCIDCQRESEQAG